MPQIDIDGANSKISADKLQGQSGSTITVPTGHTVAITDSGGLTVGGTNYEVGTTANKLVQLNGSAELPAVSGANLTGITTGKVLQVINTQITANTSGTSHNSWTDTAITNSITPSGTGSRVLIMCHAVIMASNTSGDGGYSIRFKQAISGGATSYPEELSSGTNSNYHTFHYWGSTETYARYERESMHFIASPSTTSAVTYTLQYGTYNMESISIGNGGTSGKTILTLIEIGA